jgi:hypothetical protein
MDADKPRRPRHRRKRAWAALALWFVVAWPITTGPATYACYRGWLPPKPYKVFCVVPMRMLLNPLGDATGYRRYVICCLGLGIAHAERAECAAALD